MACASQKKEYIIDFDKAALIRSRINRLRDVVNYLLEHEVLNESYKRELFQRTDEYAQIDYLIDHVQRRGLFAFDVLVDALVSTGQFELAKSLNPALHINENEDGARRRRRRRFSLGALCGCFGRKAKKDPREMEREMNEAIAALHKAFRRLENEIYASVPPADGLLPGLEVVQCTGLPKDYNTDDVTILTFSNGSDALLFQCYVHFSKPKGLAIIFNQRKFDEQAGVPECDQLRERTGTEVDCENMKRLLKGLGYHVQIENDLTVKEMSQAMTIFSEKSEHKQCDSSVVVVLTHGNDGALYGRDSKTISVKDFVAFLNANNCLALAMKPKLFILQACRGPERDKGVCALTVADGTQSEGVLRDGVPLRQLSRYAALRKLNELDEADAKAIKKTPTEADILIAYSTTPGYASWRNTEKGTWFIQEICHVFSGFAHRDHVLDLLTTVNRKVSERLTEHGLKQVPEPSYRLTKKFYFLPGL